MTIVLSLSQTHQNQHIEAASVFHSSYFHRKINQNNVNIFSFNKTLIFHPSLLCRLRYVEAVSMFWKRTSISFPMKVSQRKCIKTTPIFFPSKLCWTSYIETITIYLHQLYIDESMLNANLIFNHWNYIQNLILQKLKNRRYLCNISVISRGVSYDRLSYNKKLWFS